MEYSYVLVVKISHNYFIIIERDLSMSQKIEDLPFKKAFPIKVIDIEEITIHNIH